MRLRLAALCVLSCIGAADAEPLDEAQIRALFTDNTITGYSTEGRYFSEYHQADGRVLGNNGYYINTDACWTTKPAQVCYYYGEGDNRAVHCFTIDKTGDTLKMTLAPPSLRAGVLDATAKVEKGNPHDHTDGGHGWFCDGLISRAPVDGRLAHGESRHSDPTLR